MKASKLSLLFFFLYFLEGAPIGLIWWAIPTLMASGGTATDVITSMTAMATLPWTFKFFLGPVVDRYFFSVRSYAVGVASFQSLMLVCLLGLMLTPVGAPGFFALTVMISFASACQDVVIDAWAIGAVPANSRGHVNGAMQAGMLTGRWIFGAGLLIVLAYVNWTIAIALLCGCLVMSILILILRFHTHRERINPSASRLSLQSFRFLVTRKFAILAAIAILSGFAFEGFGAVVGPFLIANGFDKQMVGYVLSANLLAMLLGALGGGKASDAKGARFVFLLSGLVLAILVTLLGFLHLTDLRYLLVGAVCITYFFIGSFTAASYSFYMGESKGEMEATRFTFLMAMTNLCESAAAFSVGRWIAQSESTYSAGLLFASVVSLVGLVVLKRIRTLREGVDQFQNQK